MFDLDKAIASWRRTMVYNRTFTADDLDELEQHVRDQVAALRAEGLTPKEAFRQALREMGDYGTAEAEYRKVYLGKLRRQGKEKDELIWRFSMLKNYLKTAVRNLKRHPGYSFITVLGLAIGLACTIIILRHLQAELSYDDFMETADRTFRVTTTATAQDQATTYATTVPALGPALTHELPEVLHATRLMVEATESNEALFAAGDRRFYESRFAWADSTVFEVFAFPFVEGTPQTALNRPFTVVLTETTARKYFGAERAMGQVLRWNDRLDLEVTGVIADMPDQMHFHFDLLASLQTFKGLGADGMIDNWGYRGFYTYLLLAENQEVPAVEAKIAALTEARREETGGAAFRLQPVTDIHLHSHLEEEIEPNGYFLLVYLFGALASIMLFVAGVNFINLTTARSVRRAKEVGVRKVLGAYRSQLVRQFLLEAVLLALAGFLLALLLVLGLLPLLSELIGTPRGMGRGFLLAFAGITLLLGVLAGLYPALYLSAFRPTYALKGLTRTGRGPSLLRSGLVVGQFALSITLIAGTALVYQQLRFMKTADLGFDRNQVVALPLHAVFGQPQQNVDQLKEAFVRIAGVQDVSATSQLPSRVFVNNWTVRPEGTAPTDAVELTAFSVGPDFLSTLGFDLIAGRDFSEERDSDEAGVIINEATARRLGWDQPVGQSIFAGEGNEAVGTVIGVVRDFHFQSMRHAVGPSAFRLGQPFDFQYLVVRVDGARIAPTLEAMAEVWEAGSPAWPFSYLFLDDEFAAMYRSVNHMARIIGLFALLAIFVACLGMVGLTAYAIEQRTKEFGIRKALGASVADIIVLLTKRYALLLLVAFMLAVPLAYFAAARWLEDFAYRIEISGWIFLGAGLFALLVALLTVSYQAIRAALTDPVKSLRYE